MNTLACDMPSAEDSRVCHHSLQSEKCVCVLSMCFCASRGVHWLGLTVYACSGSGWEGGGVEEAVWQRDLPTVPSSVYTHTHSCVAHNPILP